MFHTLYEIISLFLVSKNTDHIVLHRRDIK